MARDISMGSHDISQEFSFKNFHNPTTSGISFIARRIKGTILDISYVDFFALGFTLGIV